MTLLISLAGAFCTVASLLHIASVLVAIRRIRRSDKSPAGPPYADEVTILRPVCGFENFSMETLGSVFDLDHAHHEILFCVANYNDPAVPLVQHLIAANPDVQARLLVGNERVGSNPKLNNLVKGWHAAKHPWVVMADSNVMMPRDYIRRLFASWRGDTGLVCSPPVGCAPDGMWAELECAFLNTYQARWQLFADSIGTGFAQGKSMLWRRDVLESSGGIHALAAEVAEDAAATKLVHRQDLRVRLVDRPFEQPLGHRTAAEFWRRQLRWARLRRGTFKGLFACEIFAGALPPLFACALSAAAIDGPVIGVSAAFASAWYATEALLAIAAGWHLSWRSIALWMLRDLMLPVLWLAGWMGNDFVWRGNEMGLADRSSTA
jgi:ceramide glucosyltransferase